VADNRGGTGGGDLDRFVSETNVQRFRALLAGPITEEQRIVIACLLAAEKAKCKRRDDRS